LLGGVAAADGEPVAEDEDVVADRNDFFFWKRIDRNWIETEAN
jgi:hypothetical protein